jgi:hypothetical protein
MGDSIIDALEDKDVDIVLVDFDPNIVKKYCGVNVKEEDCWGSLLDYLIRIQQNLPVVHQNN